MHTFYLAHDSSFAVLFLFEAYKRDWNWFCLAVSIALFVWNMFEIVCLYFAITQERQEIWGVYTTKSVTTKKALFYVIVQALAMYGIVNIVIMYIGEGSFLPVGMYD